jgi:hypothetical protein
MREEKGPSNSKIDSIIVNLRASTRSEYRGEINIAYTYPYGETPKKGSKNYYFLDVPRDKLPMPEKSTDGYTETHYRLANEMQSFLQILKVNPPKTLADLYIFTCRETPNDQFHGFWQSIPPGEDAPSMAPESKL